MVCNIIHNCTTVCCNNYTGHKRKQKNVDKVLNISAVLTKFLEVSEENERKRRYWRLSTENVRERMLMMMMGIMQQ